MQCVLLSAACDASLSLVVSRGAIAGRAPVSPGNAAGNCDLAVALVPAAARALPRAAGSDDGFERISRGRDILESWSFSLKLPFVVGTCLYVCTSIHRCELLVLSLPACVFWHIC